MDTFSK